MLAALAVAQETTRGASTSTPAFPNACGGYTVDVQRGGSPNGDGAVVLRAGGRSVYRAAAFGILDVTCTALTGQPVPDLIIVEWTGGGSCCETVEVVQLHGRPRRILEFWGKIEAIGDYRGSRTRQIFALLGNLRDFGNLCGACSPALPVVYAYEGGRYRERSSRFPDPVLAYARQEQRHFSESLRGGVLEDQKGTALGILAAHIVLGREADGWRALSQAPRAVIAWLHAHRGELIQVIDHIRK